MVVQQRLLASAKPETRAEIQRVLDKISREYDKSAPVRDYTAARCAPWSRCIRPTSLASRNSSTSPTQKKFEETVSALAVLCGVPIETADRLMAGDRPDPILILCKAAGYSWATVRAIIMSRPSAKGTSEPVAR